MELRLQFIWHSPKSARKPCLKVVAVDHLVAGSPELLRGLRLWGLGIRMGSRVRWFRVSGPSFAS